jgi:tetratricopeptide (TPR) repeat protein
MFDTAPAVGEAWFPSVARNLPGLMGLLLCVRVDPEERSPGALATAPDDRLSRAVHAWVAGLVGVQEPEVLGLPTLHITIPPHGFHTDGPSGQLAGAVALVSHLLGAPPRAPALCSGRLADPGRVAGVGELEAKRTLLELEAPGQAQTLVGSEADADPLFAAWFGEGWRGDLARATRLSPHALTDDAWHNYTTRAYRLAEIKAGEAARLGVGHTRARAEWLLGACRIHRGEAREGLALMEAAEAALQREPEPGDAPLEAHAVQELRANAGIALLDRWDVRRARSLLSSALAEVTATAPPWGRRTISVVLQVAGSLHRACVLDGDLAAAEDALRRWGLGAARLPEEEARCRIDLAEVLRRAGRPQEARVEFELAQAALPAALEGIRPFTRRFMNLYRARAGLAPAVWPIEEPRWREWPQPAEVLESLLGRSPAELEDWVWRQILGAQGGDPLPGYLVAAGAVARFEASTGARLTCAPELVRRILALSPATDPGVRAALEGLAGDAPEAWVRRSPY